MDEKEYHAQLGRVAAAMCASDEYCQYPVACLTIWIRPAILLKQIMFFREPGGVSSGYLTWGLLAEDAEERLLNDPEVVLHPSEWNEGDKLWILDLMSTSGGLRAKLRQALDTLSEYDTAYSLRRRPDGTVRKVTVWRRQRMERHLEQRRPEFSEHCVI